MNRGRITLLDLIGDAEVRLKRGAEVAADDVRDVVNVLRPQRLIQPQRLPHRHDILGTRPLARDLHGRIARDHVDQRKDERQDPERNRNHLQEPAKDVLRHESKSEG